MGATCDLVPKARTLARVIFAHPSEADPIWRAVHALLEQ